MLEIDREAHCNRNHGGFDAHVEYIAGHLIESALLRKDRRTFVVLDGQNLAS